MLQLIENQNLKFISDKQEEQNKKQAKKKKSQQINEEDKIDEGNIYHNINNPSNKVHCDGCEKDITKHAKIFCPECEIDLCVTCFSDTQTIGNHKPEHPYHVINKLNFPVYSEDWTAEEELLLLEGLSKYGYGNWQEISEHMQTGKDKYQIEEHYESIYLREDNKDYFPPQNTVLTKRDATTLELINRKSRSNSEEKNISKISKKKLKQQEKSQIQAKKAAQATGVQSSTSVSEIVGYMPKRGDFDIEFDNDAELLLAEMEFNEDDKPGEIEMKYKILDIYNARLDERIKRKKFVIERGLLDLKKQTNLDKERTKEEKEIYNMMKVFARFSEPEEHEKLVQGIIKEKQIRQRIEELRTYRKLGLKTFEEVEKYLNDKKKKDETYQKRQKQNDSFIFEKPNQGGRHAQPRRTRTNTFVDGDNKDGHKKKQIPPNMSEQEVQLCDKLGMSTYEYLVIKEVLVREAVKENFIKKDYAESTLKLDKERLTGIFDFLVTHNYILERTN